MKLRSGTKFLPIGIAVASLLVLVGFFQNCGKMSAIDGSVQLGSQLGRPTIGMIQQTFPSLKDVSPIESFSIAGTTLVCLGECAVTFTDEVAASKTRPELSTDACVGDCGFIEMTDFAGFSRIICHGDMTLLRDGLRCRNDLTLEL